MPKACRKGRSCIPMAIQDEGGVSKTVMRAVGFLKEMLPEANNVTREPMPASELILALQCGGSDGYSGISANPALGAAVDLLVRARRHGRAVGDAGDLRRRASADPPRRQPRGRREDRRAHPLVGGSLRPHRRRDEQQSLARQQGGRPHHHPREIAGRGRQGRHDATWSMSTNMPSRSPPRASSSWIRPATTRCRRPARWRAAPTSCASPPAAARSSAASRRRRSSSPPTRRSIGA